MATTINAQPKRPTILTILYDNRERVLGRLKALGAEPSPWYVEGRYIADPEAAATYRGFLIQWMYDQLDLLDRKIADECDVLFGALADDDDARPPILTVVEFEAEVARRYPSNPPPRAA